MTSNARHSLNTIPFEILEHVALFVATGSFLGPPSDLVPLLATCRKIFSALSCRANPLFYAQIFTTKFDYASTLRRLAPQGLPGPQALASELQHRCQILRRLRYGRDTLQSPQSTQVGEPLRAVLWSAYLMMLENDGRNERQLREYARIEGWLNQFWVHRDGASLAWYAIKQDHWPQDNERNALAMWLFWFLLRPDDYARRNTPICETMSVLKVLALGAHQYGLTTPTWTQFTPVLAAENVKPVSYYGESRNMILPPLATPAILSFLSLNRAIHGAAQLPGSGLLTDSPAVSTFPYGSREWDGEWERCHSLGRSRLDSTFTRSFRPGSIEGMWEGIFTYTEFTAYAALLSGAPPRTLMNSLVVQHHQMWKLREYHLVSLDDSKLVSGTKRPEPLTSGNALRSYFPNGISVTEDAAGLHVLEPGRKETLHYRRADTHQRTIDHDRPPVLDIIIAGEGHSAWGQFALRGRIRPCDGFISLSKEYMGGDRGVWLYRGYLVGNTHGCFAGRWRDTLSPPDVSGYEGCFLMSRRR